MTKNAESFEKLKEEGNQFYREGRYENALTSYQHALEIDPNAPVIHSNMSAIYLKLGNYSEAYKHASISVKNEEFKEKSLYRLGKAAYGLKNWPLAKEHFEDLCKRFPSNSSGAIELLNIKADLDEPQSSKVDINNLYSDVDKNHKRTAPFDDYYGPIEIFQSPKKGRGLRVTKDIRAGTLLIAEKVYATGKRSYGEVFSSTHPLVMSIQKRARERPETVKFLNALYTGASDKNRSFEERILLVAKYNKSDFYDSVHMDKLGRQKEMYCLMLMPTFINHSCMKNVEISFYGDICVVVALKDLKAGDELFDSYIPTNMLYEERQKELQRGWNFICTCTMCELDKADGEERRKIRRECMDQLESIGTIMDTNPRLALNRLQALISKMKETYKNRKHPLHLIPLLNSMCKARMMPDVSFEEKRMHLLETIRTYEEIVAICEPDMRYEIMPIYYYYLCQCYGILGNQNMVEQWEDRAHEYIKITTGISDKNLQRRILEKNVSFHDSLE